MLYISITSIRKWFSPQIMRIIYHLAKKKLELSRERQRKRIEKPKSEMLYFNNKSFIRSENRQQHSKNLKLRKKIAEK